MSNNERHPSATLNEAKTKWVSIGRTNSGSFGRVRDCRAANYLSSVDNVRFVFNHINYCQVQKLCPGGNMSWKACDVIALSQRIRSVMIKIRTDTATDAEVDDLVEVITKDRDH